LIKKELIRNAVAVCAVSAVMNTLGIIFRTYASNRAGAEALGLLQLVTSVYYPACTLASSGIYVASTQLCARAMARKDRDTEKIVTKCLIYSLLFGTAAFLLLYFGAESIANQWLRFPAAKAPLRILSFGLPFLAAANALQGFFLSMRKATFSTVLQVSEDLLKMGATLFFFPLFTARGPEGILCALVAGMTVGEIGSCLFGYALYRRKSIGIRGTAPERGVGFLDIAKIALPCAFSAYLRSGVGIAESMLVPRGLQASGLTEEQTLAALGKLDGMALPILMYPAAFLAVVSKLLVPEIAAENATGHETENKSTTESVLRWTLTYSIFLALFALLFGEELGIAIYGDVRCGRYLVLLAPLVPILYCDRVTDGIMKGYNRQLDTVRINLTEAILRTFAACFLLPVTGIAGYVATFAAGTVLNFVFSFLALKKVSNIRFPWEKGVLIPIVTGLGAILPLKTIQQQWPLPLWMRGTVSAILFLLLLRGWSGKKPRDGRPFTVQSLH